VFGREDPVSAMGNILAAAVGAEAASEGQPS
jgi:hypothetical protein